LNDVVIVVLSDGSTRSDWVENELEMARQKERQETRDVLCPIALDDSWRTKMELEESNRVLWRTLASKFIVDFSNWKTEREFDESFRKLLRGLKLNYDSRQRATPAHQSIATQTNS
jgi:hypothetical protein